MILRKSIDITEGADKPIFAGDLALSILMPVYRVPTSYLNLSERFKERVLFLM
jgi:hypothetical protein